MEFLELPIVRDILILILALAVSAIAHRIVRTYLMEWLYRLFRKTPAKWDDYIIEAGVFRSLAMIPGIIMFRTVPFPAGDRRTCTQLLKAAAILLVALTLDRLMKAGAEDLQFLQHFGASCPKGFVQIVQIAMWVFAGTAVFSLLLGSRPGPS